MGTILECYTNDLSIQEFSRNSEHGIEDRTKLEVECLKNTDSSFQFYRILNGDDLVGYFGIEDEPVKTLTTFFIMPKYRDNKDQVWDFIVSHLPEQFFAGLFKVNSRAIKFFEKKGGIQIGETLFENKPSVVFYFKR